MSSKSEKMPAKDAQAFVNFESWREEIETFCRQTVAHLQELIDAVEMAESEIDDSCNSEDAQVSSISTSSVPKSSAPRDLDTSQDRLANLKRELAAKLSNASRDVK